MTKKKSNRWHRNPPTKPGWYEASQYKTWALYRWWNGTHWSCAAMEGDDIHEVARSANQPYPLGPKDTMYWREIKL